MGNIVNNPDGDPKRVVVRMHIADLLRRPYYIQDGPGLKPYPTGDTIEDAIRRVGWLLLNRNAPKIAAGKFPYGSVEAALDGTVEITFWREVPEGGLPPEAP